MAAGRRPVPGSHRLLRPGDPGLFAEVSMGPARRPREGAADHQMARPPPVVDAGLPSADRAGALADRRDQSSREPRDDGAVRRVRGLRLSHPGHRHRRLAHRGGDDREAGRDGRRLPVGLPDRHDRGRRRTAGALRIRRLEHLLRDHGAADGCRRAGRAGSPARGPARGPPDRRRRHSETSWPRWVRMGGPAGPVRPGRPGAGVGPRRQCGDPVDRADQCRAARPGRQYRGPVGSQARRGFRPGRRRADRRGGDIPGRPPRAGA